MKATTKYMVYWSTLLGPHSKSHDELNEALAYTETLRKRAKEGDAINFITMSAECIDQVGAMGVDSVEDGKTPGGHDYNWMKRRNS